MYHAYALLQPSSDFSLKAAAPKLKAKFPELKQDLSDRQLMISSEDWEIHLTTEEGPDVLEESSRIADHISGAEDELGIRTCNRRVDVASDVPDPRMEHFDDYLKVIEVLRTFRGVILIDPDEPSLL